MAKAATARRLDEAPAFTPDFVHDPSTVVLDQGALDAIREMESPTMPDVLEQIVEVYLEHAQNQVNTLAEAVETSDIETQNRIAHNLKSSSANLGAHDLAALCQTLETATQHGPSDRAGDLSVKIIDTFAKVHAALLVELAKG